MYLTLDIGNTRVKLAAFDRGNLVRSEAFAPMDAGASVGLLPLVRAVDTMARELRTTWQAVAWCRTGRVPDGFAEWAEGLAPTVLHVTGLTPTPLRMAYGTPRTLGADRLAAAVGAAALLPGQHLLVVDIGTCITYDIVRGGHTYVGGNISPGLHMRLHALHEHTAALPLVDPEGDTPMVGYDTPTAIRAGVMHGMRAEVLGIIARLRGEYPGLQVWLTGGDTLGITSADGLPLHRDSALVARGLYNIIRYACDNSTQTTHPTTPQ